MNNYIFYIRENNVKYFRKILGRATPVMILESLRYRCNTGHMYRLYSESDYVIHTDNNHITYQKCKGEQLYSSEEDIIELLLRGEYIGETW